MDDECAEEKHIDWDEVTRKRHEIAMQKRLEYIKESTYPYPDSPVVKFKIIPKSIGFT